MTTVAQLIAWLSKRPLMAQVFIQEVDDTASLTICVDGDDEFGFGLGGREDDAPTTPAELLERALEGLPILDQLNAMIEHRDRLAKTQTDWRTSPEALSRLMMTTSDLAALQGLDMGGLVDGHSRANAAKKPIGLEYFSPPVIHHGAMQANIERQLTDHLKRIARTPETTNALLRKKRRAKKKAVR